MKSRELGPKSVVVGDIVSLVGDVSGNEGSLARIVAVNPRRNSLSRTVDDAAKIERTIVANIDYLVIVAATANPEPRRGLIDRFLVCAFHEGISPILLMTKTDLAPLPDFIEEYRALGVHIVSTSSKKSDRQSDVAKIHELLAEKTKAIVAQYSAYVVLDSMHVNGEATQGENIADLGGVVMGYEAFKKTKQGKNNEMINGLTADQRYFLAYGYAWMVNRRPENLARQIMSDVHSPSEFRVNGPVVNIDEFYKAFNIQKGDKMWRDESQRVKIW